MSGGPHLTSLLHEKQTPDNDYQYTRLLIMSPNRMQQGLSTELMKVP